MELLEQNPKLGFYTVNGKTFYSKPQALLEATITGQFPTWNFNQEIFSGIDSTVEPELGLRELYRMRAQQLRDRYDYIRLEFSGGSDSTTVLYSFINNGIHLDEVVFRYPKEGEKDVADDPFNYKCENTLSEARYAAYPVLDWLRTASPSTKISLHDYSVDMIKCNYDESWVYKTKDYFQPGHAFKHSKLGYVPHKAQADSGMSICVLYGVDKPKICIKDSKWYLYFIDIIANHSITDFGEYRNVITEYFYWSPDLPELLIKQCHLIRRWFDLPQNQILQYVCRWPNYSYTHRNAYECILRPLLYPDYDQTTFQTVKATNSFYNEMDFWFYKNFQDTDAYKTWQAGLKHITQSIDPKFFNYEMGKPVGFVGFLSPFYYLGDAAFIDSGENIHHRF